MGYPKKQGYGPEFEICSHISLAFTHPVRIRILKYLSRKSMTHDEICKVLPLCNSTVSHHLKILLDRGLVQYEEKFPWIYYELDETGLKKFLEKFDSCIREILGD